MNGKIVGGPIAILCLVAGAAIADEGRDSGRTAFVPTASEQLELPNGHMMQRVEASGINITDDAESPLNGNGITCEGVFIAGADGSAEGGGGSCHLINADGDVAFAWWKQTSEAGGVWGLMGGTGSFEGISGKGNYTSKPPLPNGSWVNKWDISWKIE
jgi:hypothetical protein